MKANAIVFRTNEETPAADSSAVKSSGSGALGRTFVSCAIFNGRNEFVETKMVRQIESDGVVSIDRHETLVVKTLHQAGIASAIDHSVTRS